MVAKGFRASLQRDTHFCHQLIQGAKIKVSYQGEWWDGAPTFSRVGFDGNLPMSTLSEKGHLCYINSDERGGNKSKYVTNATCERRISRFLQRFPSGARLPTAPYLSVFTKQQQSSRLRETVQTQALKPLGSINPTILVALACSSCASYNQTRVNKPPASPNTWKLVPSHTRYLEIVATTCCKKNLTKTVEGLMEKNVDAYVETGLH